MKIGEVWKSKHEDTIVKIKEFGTNDYVNFSTISVGLNSSYILGYINSQPRKNLFVPLKGYIMKIGEVWEYKGKNDYTSDQYGKHWSEAEDDVDSYWYMKEVRITDMFTNEFGECVRFEALEGEPHPMEAVYEMPKVLFLKEYSKVY